MNIEDEIDNIIKNIEKTEYLSFKDVEYNKQLAIDNIYSNYMNYEVNKKNKQEAIDELKDYEYITFEQLKEGDYIRYFDLRAFYNLRLMTGGKIMKMNINDNGDMIIRSGAFLNTLKPNIFFRKIPEDTLVKMRLIEMIEK